MLDSLELPCPIRGQWSDGPVRFGSVLEAVEYLESELDLWVEERNSGAPVDRSQPAVMDKSALFYDDADSKQLCHQLRCGVDALDANVDRVRLDRYVHNHDDDDDEFFIEPVSVTRSNPGMN